MSTATVNRVAWMVHEVSGCACAPGIPTVAHVGQLADQLTRAAGRRGFDPLYLSSDEAAVLIDEALSEPVTRSA